MDWKQQNDSSDQESVPQDPQSADICESHTNNEALATDAIGEKSTADSPESKSEENGDECHKDSQPAETDNTTSPEGPDDTANVIYRWTYEDQNSHDQKDGRRQKKSGVLTFAIVMAACFGVSFAILLVSIITGGLPALSSGDGNANGNRIVYVRQWDDESGVLTLQEIAAKGNASVVAISVETSFSKGVGTGIILSSDGYIATNYHVVNQAGEGKITVYDYNGNRYEGRVVGYSEADDLAVIKIDADGLAPAEIGDSSSILVGDGVVVIGHPGGLSFGWSATEGIISCANRVYKKYDSSGTLTSKMNLIQTSANVNSGNSGGPMLNDRGQVIGIITMKLADDFEGMGFALPINGAMKILNAIIETGTADGVDSEISSGRPLLGIVGVGVEADHYYYLAEDEGRIYPLTEDEAKATDGAFYATHTGVLITGVTEGMDAAGKIEKNDIIIAVDGIRTESIAAMSAILNDKDIGDEVNIEYIRDKESYTVKVRLSSVK